MAFDGLPTEITDRGFSWYRIQVFPFRNSYQIIGFGYVYNTDTSPDQIEVYTISGLSGKAEIDTTPIYIETDIDSVDIALQADEKFVIFTKEWGLAYHQAYASHPTFGWLGSPKNSILNFGPHGTYNLDSIIEQTGDTTYSDPPWAEDGSNITTVIGDEIFNNIAVITTSGDGNFLLVSTIFRKRTSLSRRPCNSFKTLH